jgi:hypothetical protein
MEPGIEIDAIAYVSASIKRNAVAEASWMGREKDVISKAAAATIREEVRWWTLAPRQRRRQ